MSQDKPLVLVVEDEEILRLIAVEQLEDAGFDVISAGDAAEALLEIERVAEVTTVFTDINMPGPFDGLCLAHKLSRLRPALRVIITSGRGEPERSQIPPGVRFLSKPYEIKSLTDLISAA